MKNLFIAFICICFVSCGSNTSIVASWRDPNVTTASENFKKVLIVSLVKNETTRRVTENRIANLNPTLFHSSYSYLNATSTLTQEQKLSALNSEGFDGVITLRLVSTEKETNYVPGTNTSLYYGGMGGMYGGMYGYGFGNWYGAYSPGFYSPGYYEENTFYIVETNIFSLKENKLIWTATTKSMDVSNLDSTIDGIMKANVDEMRKNGFMAK